MKKLYVFFACVLLMLYTSCDEFDAGLDKHPAVEEEADKDIVIPDEEDKEFDNGYIEDNYLHLSEEEILKVDNPHEAMAERWPGMPGDYTLEPRLANVRVGINAVYTILDPHVVMNPQTPWFSTGLYASPAEYIIIKKPESLNGKRITVRIGSSHCVSKKFVERAEKTFVRKDLKDNDTTHVMNYYGGNIYIIPAIPLSEPVVFEITGAMKSPDFILGKTDPIQWKADIRRTTIPSAEIIGRKNIWTIPTGVDALGAVDDPVALAEFYDDAVDKDFNDFHGLSSSSFDPVHQPPSYPSRNSIDIEICAGAAHSGYPVMYGLTYGVRACNLEGMSQTNLAWGYYHELGHNFQNYFWKWGDGEGGVSEVTCNLHIMHARTRVLGTWAEGTEQYKEKYIDKFVNVENPDKNFDRNSTGDLIMDVSGRMIPFMQLAQQYGWRIFAYMSAKGRELHQNRPVVAKIIGSSIAVGRRDFFCISASEYAGVNLMPFFDAWGIKYSDNAKIDMQKLEEYGSRPKFWTDLDLTKIPSFEYNAPKKLIDTYSYGMVQGELNRALWEVIDQSSYYNDEDKYSISSAFNDDASSFWSSVSNSVPFFEVNLNGPNTITGFKIVHRKHDLQNLMVKKFNIKYKLNKEDNWIVLGEFEIGAGNGATQEVILDDLGIEAVQAGFFHFECTETHGGSFSNGVSVAIFSVYGYPSGMHD